MDTARWNDVKQLFGEALALPDPERAALLAATEDAELRAEVEALLASYEEAHSYFGGLADDLLGPSWIEPDAPAAPQPDPHGLVGRRISHYEVLSKLGGGGMGVVYKARDVLLGRLVALKLLPPHLSESEDAETRFLHEARAASALDHPHVGTIYEVGRGEDGRPFIAMAFYEGATLKEVIADGPLPIEQALGYAVQIARGLAAAHALGIVHRDVKPANVLVTEGGVKLLDFGLAKVSDVQLTGPGALMGTAAYMSPEQARGTDVDPRTDLWALGVLLYEMLSGQRPFRSTHEQAVVYAVLNEHPDPLDRVRPEVPAALARLVHRLLEKDPAARYPDAATLADDLEAVAAGRPVEAPPAPLPVPPFLRTRGAEAPPSEAPLFVARDRELALLDERLAAAWAGQGGVVFITGDAGTGKTALTRAFARRVLETHPEAAVVTGHCNAHTGLGDPYLPFREVLALLSGDVEARYAAGTLSREHARRLWALLPLTARALAETAPDLVDVFVPGAPLLSRAAAYASLLPSWLGALEAAVRRRAAAPPDPSLQQSDLFEQYSHVLHAVAREHPLVLILEDLHWADTGTVSLLFHLARRLEGRRVLLVGTYRPADVAVGIGGERHPLEPVLNELRRDFGEIDIEVGKDGGQEFVDALLDAEPNRLGPDFRAALFRQTQGHSLFTVELLRALRERAMLVRDADGRWSPAASLDWGLLPARVEGAIGERIDRLPAPLRTVLTAASVEGEEFTAQVVARTQQMEEREVVRLLSGTLDRQHRLVVAQDLRTAAGGRLSIYRFRHILFQRYLYDRLDAAERMYLHEDVGTALEALYGDDADAVAGALARHFQEAGQTARAVDYLAQAGERAVRLAATREALGHFEQGLALLQALPEGPERDARELRLQGGRALAIQASFSLAAPQLEEALERARTLSRRLGEAAAHARVLLFSTQFHAMRAEYVQAHALTEQLLGMARHAGEPLLLNVGLGLRGFIALFRGALDDAHADNTAALAFYEEQPQHAMVAFHGFAPSVNTQAWTAWTDWLLGHPDQARASSTAAIEQARALGHPLSLAFALLVPGAMLHRHLGEVDRMEALAEEAVRLSAEKGFGHYQALGMVLLGWVLVERGALAEGIEQMRAAWGALWAGGARLNFTEYTAMLAEALHRAGRIDEGLAALDDGLDFAEMNDEQFYVPELHRLRGTLLAARDDAEAAEAAFRRALDAARDQRARAWMLRAATSLARLLHGQGRTAEAHRPLRDAYDRFTDGFDTPDLRDARALLDALDAAE